jgi:hypothetical protein
MCNLHTKFKLDDFIMYINGNITVPVIIKEKEDSSLTFISYKFKSTGLFNVTVSFKITLRYCIG